MQFVVVGNPENRRVQFLKEAIAKKGLPELKVVSYQSLLENREVLAEVLSPGCCLKVESPGENPEAFQKLVALGEDSVPDYFNKIPAHKILSTPLEFGRIQYGAQWYAGFSKLLDEIDNLLTKHPEVQVVNAPGEIKMLFDKVACSQEFLKQGISAPPFLGVVRSYDHLQEILQTTGHKQVFIKPAHGSSASGVMAYRQNSQGKELMTTSVEMVKEGFEIKLFNNLKIRKYNKKEDIATIINTLAKEHLYMEQWLPKTQTENGLFDLRCVSIGGKARQMVMRQSHHPMTNLHLGNQRGDLEQLQNRLPEDQWHSILQIAEKAARVFPQSNVLGLDIALNPKQKNPFVIEANAFGDLLPHVLHRGETTYEAMVTYYLQQNA
ncbi:STM4014 family protein [Rapidithrix thailandica]|uniref:STM4014 family protein n=1 Tax=Rapidithrix thailandica TaxID=413964 RepID=A0AAW9SC57_9BACT